MLILIESDNGEQYDEYRDWISQIYDVPNETGETLKVKYHDHL